jgi:hypothetical protein
MDVTEKLKAVSEIGAVDPRFAGHVLRDPQTGNVRPITIADHHRWIADSRLIESVPIDIRESFAVGQNLMLYAWFSYPFLVFSQLHFVGCIEHSLRVRLGLAASEPPPGRGFVKLLKIARRERLLLGLELRDAQWPTWIPGPHEHQSAENWFFDRAARVMNLLRNSVAHGWPTLQPDGGLFMRVAA